MIKLVQTERDYTTGEKESSNLESSKMATNASCTKRFLAKIEEDIGVRKVGYGKPHFLKAHFRAETIKKYRDNGGIPPSNEQASLRDNFALLT